MIIFWFNNNRFKVLIDVLIRFLNKIIWRIKTSVQKMEKLRERCESARSMKSCRDERCLTKNAKNGNEIRLAIPSSLRTRLPPYYREMQDQINNADPETSRKMKVSIALKHLEEQKSKGNVSPNGEKSCNFEKHPLPEINAILYGFTLESNGKEASL
jgi:hypothetical protein